jgi:hypothetical protein
VGPNCAPITTAEGRAFVQAAEQDLIKSSRVIIQNPPHYARVYRELRCDKRQTLDQMRRHLETGGTAQSEALGLAMIVVYARVTTHKLETMGGGTGYLARSLLLGTVHRWRPSQRPEQRAEPTQTEQKESANDLIHGPTHAVPQCVVGCCWRLVALGYKDRPPVFPARACRVPLRKVLERQSLPARTPRR